METTVPPGLAFESFYRAEWASLLRAISFAVGDRELARECVDEAMARAFERWDAVAAMDRPAGWVYRVAINLARSRGRRKALERRKRPPAERPAPPADGVADPAIARALAALPLHLRSVIVLRFYLDWSVDDVAKALGVAPGTVKSRLHRGLRRLERSLGEPV